MPTCIHGQLARSCDLCDSDQKDAVIMSLEGTVARLTAENARLWDVVQAAEGYHNARQAWLGNWEPANGPYVDALNDAWLAYHRALANLRERAALDAKEGERE